MRDVVMLVLGAAIAFALDQVRDWRAARRTRADRLSTFERESVTRLQEVLSGLFRATGDTYRERMRLEKDGRGWRIETTPQLDELEEEVRAQQAELWVLRSRVRDPRMLELTADIAERASMVEFAGSTADAIEWMKDLAKLQWTATGYAGELLRGG